MKTTKTVGYALACIAELAKRMGEFVQVSEIAAAQNIPVSYCQKVLLALSRSGIVVSVKGQGFCLAIAPENISTLKVMQAMREDSAAESEMSDSIRSIGDTLAMKVNAALAALTVADVLMAGR